MCFSHVRRHSAARVLECMLVMPSLGMLSVFSFVLSENPCYLLYLHAQA